MAKSLCKVVPQGRIKGGYFCQIFDKSLNRVNSLKAKEMLYKEQCAAQNVEFMAAAICSYGGWLPEGIAFIK